MAEGPAVLPAGANWHSLSVAETASTVAADLDTGLGSAEAVRRLQQFGPNRLPEPKSPSLLAVFFRQFKSPLIYILLGAAVLAAAIGERSDAIVILVVVLINAIIGAVQEGRAHRSLAALHRMTAQRARVVRDGKEQLVESAEVVPGDVLALAAGDVVTADARLALGASLQMAEAALTGESLPVPKNEAPLDADTGLGDRKNMVYAGTHVAAGRARAVVVATGVATEIGQIAKLAAGSPETRTPLERRVAHFGRIVIVAALVLFVLVLAVGLIRGVATVEILMVATSQLVGMIPEGLPVALTIALAVGVQRMARRRALVRRLSAVETLGSTTVICTDKTGTLTRNEMTVTDIYLPDGRTVAVSGVGYAPEGGSLSADGAPGDRLPEDPALGRLVQAVVLCNDATLTLHPHAEGAGRWRPVGDPTEVALVTLALKAGLSPARVRETFRRRAELPFDAATKMMATEHTTPAGSLVIVKGAPEMVLDLCRLSPGRRDEVRAAAESMAKRALRVLAVAEGRGEHVDGEVGFEAFSRRLDFVGLVGQMDPPRQEVADAIRLCQDAGIRPVMLTGDHRVTAEAVAEILGLRRPGDRTVDGPELARMSEEELAAQADRIAVFARVHPAQKVRIVEALQRRREVVAMTGDGVNDAPALVRADVGVAMGITGTDVAKDAAKIVIADDNFATIVSAVEQGRIVYRNIQKVILLLFSTSAAEVLVLLLALLAGFPPPFFAVQILWNNLVTEGVITVNLIMEPGEGDEMKRRPIHPNQPLIDRLMLGRLATMSATITLCTLGWFIVRTSMGIPEMQVRTETFTLLAVCEWWNVLNCRSERKSALEMGLLRNPWLLGGLALGNLLQVAVVFWRPLGEVFHTVPFDMGVVVALGVVGSLVLWVEEARKLLVRRRQRGRRNARVEAYPA